SILFIAHLYLASLPRTSDVVPQADDRFITGVVLEPEYANAGRAAEEKAPGAWGQAKPAGCDHADDVAARECQYITVDVAHSGDKAVGPGGDVFGSFAVGAAVAEHFPAGPLLQDVPG